MSLHFKSDETHLLIEALHELRLVKLQAQNTFQEAYPQKEWHPRDFGIPTIDGLIKRLEDYEETIDV